MLLLKCFSVRLKRRSWGAAAPPFITHIYTQREGEGPPILLLQILQTLQQTLLQTLIKLYCRHYYSATPTLKNITYYLYYLYPVCIRRPSVCPLQQVSGAGWSLSQHALGEGQSSHWQVTSLFFVFFHQLCLNVSFGASTRDWLVWHHPNSLWCHVNSCDLTIWRRLQVSHCRAWWETSGSSQSVLILNFLPQLPASASRDLRALKGEKQ